MKKGIAVVFAGLLALQLGGAVVSAEDKAPGKGPEKRVERLTRELGLNADQQQKVSAILEELHAENKALMEKMKSSREAADLKIKEVLTPEQWQKFEQMKEKVKGKMGMKHGEGHSCPPGQGPEGK